MAATKYIRTARKLQTACNKVYGIKLLIDQRQWYHEAENMTVTAYTLYQMRTDPETGKRAKIKLFQTYSQVQLVLFLRDYWYTLHGWEIPTNNKQWEEIKKDYEEQEKATDIDPTV